MKKISAISLCILLTASTLYAGQEASLRNNPYNSQGYDFPKVENEVDEQMAHKFSWWPTDAKPAPVKDPDRSGFWWWPQVPGEMRPWGNQGYIYVRKIIFDYRSAAGEMKPSLIIKKILRNVKIYFDYDKSDLRQDGIDILSKALYTLEKNQNTQVLISGNCDTRGSEQYNLKLGERRADAVRKYLVDNGVPEDRIKILSQGKLNAIAPANDLVGMQKDRNAQFMVAEVEEIMIPASQAALYEDPQSPGQSSIQTSSGAIQPKQVIEETENLEGEIKVDFKEYVIQKGDTLWAIAEREYGRGTQWRRIYEFNKDVISNPDRPKKGAKIRIPIE
jgi:outer membrane protein OmpA-like peptidoglycan-associated protein